MVLRRREGERQIGRISKKVTTRKGNYSPKIKNAQLSQERMRSEKGEKAGPLQWPSSTKWGDSMPGGRPGHESLKKLTSIKKDEIGGWRCGWA